MKFGPVGLADAEGAILAHSVPLDGGRLRKGKLLTAEDLEMVSKAGITTVTVARLEPADVVEDVAAGRLARALVPDPDAVGLTLGRPATGRVNIHAAGPGVADVDAGRIAAVNRIDPMITVATVPEWQRMTARGMVATVKIISYAVDEVALATAERAAKAALSLRAPVLKTATLVQTSVGGGVTDKGHQVTRERLERLGVTLAEPVTVPHDTEAIAAALGAASSDLLLILTGSATSDVNDVAPSAVRRAGGDVQHYGMPVDPGNLLFLGALGGRAVIGLPGCAKSPALNGADWVLERIVCGVPVTPSDISAMGVGGLLKEIPTRPQPRDP